MKKRILFLCTHNSARSQMAEGYLRVRYGDRYEVHSAGTEPASVHPAAVAVMREIGIDISGQRAKPLSEFAGKEMDLVVTVCESARGPAPSSRGQKRRCMWNSRILPRRADRRLRSRKYSAM